MSEDEDRVERVAEAIYACEYDTDIYPLEHEIEPIKSLLMRQARAAIAAATAWQPIETAPKDGTKIDLLFPYPRGRQKDCQWRQDGVYGDGNWFWSIPKWGSQPGHEWHLLPEDEWDVGGYPNMQPTHWMPIPEPPR